MVHRSLWVPVVTGIALLASGIPLAHAEGGRDRDSFRDGGHQRQEDHSRGSSGASAGRLLGSSPSRSSSGGSGERSSRSVYIDRSADGTRSSSSRGGYNGSDRWSGERTRPYATQGVLRFPQSTTGVPDNTLRELQSINSDPHSERGDGLRNRPSRLGTEADSSRVRPYRPRTFGSGSSGPSGVRLDSPRDSRHANGVTDAGRVLGTSAPVDRYGRTEVGRALGTRAIPTERLSGERVGTTPNRPYRFHHAPSFGYNPHNGSYERFRSGSGFEIGVLLGTGALRGEKRSSSPAVAG